jgi:regulator of sigma E protease
VLTLTAFVIAISLLIAIHEYGHYRMALACGVQVLRFSIGFGKPMLRWQSKTSSTEFVLAMLPLGGYVKMLDEREGPVDPAQRHLAFNTQTLGRRAAIVAAGPLANLLLAIVLYAAVNWTGVTLPAAVIAPPAVGTLASQAGLIGGDRVMRVALGDDAPQDVQSYEDLRWAVTHGALRGEDVLLTVSRREQTGHEVLLKLSAFETADADARLFVKIGLMGPFTRPVIGDVMPDGAAARAGLRKDDEVLAINQQDIIDGQQLRQYIRSAAADGRASQQIWKLLRDGQPLELQLTPQVVTEGDKTVGRIGAYVGAAPEQVEVRYGLFDGLWRGVVQTWDISALTLRMMGKMLIGEASVKNLSGPLTIADYAGKSAGMGLTQYLLFLALISVSLGVLNLLPLPILDGGHLMYYLWEAVTGRPVSDRWMDALQRGGMALLAVVMTIALFNDVTRLFG